MRYVAEVCDIKEAGRALLWAMSYRANPRSGVCSAGQRRLAREAGISRASVQRWLPRLLADGELEEVFEGSGTHPACYRIVGRGRVSSGPTTSPQGSTGDGPVDSSVSTSGLIEGALVDSSGPASGLVVRHKGSEGFNLKGEQEGAAESALDERALSAGRAHARPPSPNPIDIDGARYFPVTYQTRAELLKHYVAEALHGGHPLTPNCMAADDGLCYMRDEYHPWPSWIPDEQNGQEQAGKVER